MIEWVLRWLGCDDNQVLFSNAENVISSLAEIPIEACLPLSGFPLQSKHNSKVGQSRIIMRSTDGTIVSRFVQERRNEQSTMKSERSARDHLESRVSGEEGRINK